ncbi:MAG: hypothetical protein L0Y70_02545 [Gemmataceae bacterium]|nr:hypothetical protein [Gemmataceae bacterium]
MRRLHVIAGLVLAGLAIWSMRECDSLADERLDQVLLETYAAHDEESQHLEDAATPLLRVAQNLIRHFRTLQNRNPEYAAVVDRLQVELTDMSRGE